MPLRMPGNYSPKKHRGGARAQPFAYSGWPKRRRFLIVHNATAGMSRRWLLEQVCHELEANGADLTIVAADSSEDD